MPRPPQWKNPFVALLVLFTVLSWAFIATAAVSLGAHASFNSPNAILTFAGFDVPNVGKQWIFELSFAPPIHDSNPELTTDTINSVNLPSFIQEVTTKLIAGDGQTKTPTYNLVRSDSSNPTVTLTYTLNVENITDKVELTIAMFYQTSASIQVRSPSGTQYYQWNPRYVFTPGLYSLFPSYNYYPHVTFPQARLVFNRLPGLKQGQDPYCLTVQFPPFDQSPIPAPNAPSGLTTTLLDSSAWQFCIPTASPPVLPFTLVITLPPTTTVEGSKIVVFQSEQDKSGAPTVNSFENVLPTAVLDSSSVIQPESIRINILSYENLGLAFNAQSSTSVWYKIKLQYRPISTNDKLFILPQSTVREESHVYWCKFANPLSDASIDSSAHTTNEFTITNPAASINMLQTIECYTAVSSLFRFLNDLNGDEAWTSSSITYTPFSIDFAISAIGSNTFMNSAPINLATFNNLITPPSQPVPLPTVLFDIGVLTDSTNLPLPILLTDSGVYERYSFKAELPGHSWSVGFQFELPPGSLPAPANTNQRLSPLSFIAQEKYWSKSPTSTTSQIGRSIQYLLCTHAAGTGGTVVVSCESQAAHRLDLSRTLYFYKKNTVGEQPFSYQLTLKKYHHNSRDVVVAKKAFSISASTNARYPQAFGAPVASVGPPGIQLLQLTHSPTAATPPPPAADPTTYLTFGYQSIWVFTNAFTTLQSDSIEVICEDQSGNQHSVFVDSVNTNIEIDLASRFAYSPMTFYYCTMKYHTKPTAYEVQQGFSTVVSTFTTSWFHLKLTCHGISFATDGSLLSAPRCPNCQADGKCLCSAGKYGLWCENDLPTLQESIPLNQAQLSFTVPQNYKASLSAESRQFTSTASGVFDVAPIIAALFSVQPDHPSFNQAVSVSLKLTSLIDPSSYWTVSRGITFINTCSANGLSCLSTGSSQCLGTTATGDLRCVCHDDYFGMNCAFPKLAESQPIVLGQPYIQLQNPNAVFQTNNIPRLTIALSQSQIPFTLSYVTGGFSLAALWSSIDVDQRLPGGLQLTFEYKIFDAYEIELTSRSVTLTLVDKCTHLQCNDAGTETCSTFCLCKSNFQGERCDIGYFSATRTMKIAWTAPQSQGTKTAFYRIAILPNERVTDLSQFGSKQSKVIWTTASYLVSTQFVSIADASTQITDAFWIPDFISHADIKIPFVDTITGLTIFLVPEGSPTAAFLFNFSAAIPSICQGSPQCSAGCNPYYSTGCVPDTTSSAVGTCAGLVCPPAMIVDLLSCSCQCNSPVCLANTRVAMLYFNNAQLEATFTPRFRSYVTRTMQTELALSLGLNPLPQPLPSSVTTPPNRLRGYINDGDVDDVSAPVGFEQLHLIPITYDSLQFTSLIAYITITPFASITSTTSLEPRWTTLQQRLRKALNAQQIFLQINDRIHYSLSHLIDANSAYNASLRKLTTAKLGVQCVHPTDVTTSTLTCPSVSAIYSPFWSTCAQNQRQLTVQCRDFAGKVYNPTPTPSNGFCAAPFYPGYPKQTVVGCQSTNYADANISEFKPDQNTPSPIKAGVDSVLFTWSYPPTANPTYTVDIFVRKAGSPMIVSEFDQDDEVENDSSNDEAFDVSYEEDHEAMTIQQSLSAGYRVLLGTYPAKDQVAFVSIPETLGSGFETDMDAIFIIRVTQQANRLESIQEYANVVQIRPKNLCDNVTCGNKQSCTKGKCVCGSGLKFDENGECISVCTGLCKNGTTCLDTGVCDCGQSFSGMYCEIDKGCVVPNKQLCKNRGSVLFNSATNTCGAECTCFSTNHWTFDPTPAEGTTTPPDVNSNCNKCDLLDFNNNQLCDPIGTSPTRTTILGCVKCECAYGFSGDRCQFRVAYGTITFTPPSTDPFIIIQAVPLQTTTPAAHVTGTLLNLDEDTRTVLIRDMALSLNIPADSLTLKQAIQIAAPTPSGMNILQSSTRNAVTFELQQTQDANLSNLYDLWGDVQKNFDSTPIGQTEAGRAVGAPVAAEPVFDPQCDTTVAGNNCPTGSNPLVADQPVEDDTEPLIPDLDATSSRMGAGTIVAIVVPIVLAVLIIVAAVVVVGCMKKHQKGCFAPEKKKATKNNNNDDVELGSASSFTQNSLTATKATSKTPSAPTAYSSGTSTSVDLVETDLDLNEPELPSGWRKMKHTGTSAIIYINESAMISQKTHPNKPGGVVVSDLGW